jgi:CRISPR-associated endonuclease Cas1
MIQAPDFKEKQILFLDAQEIKSCQLKLGNENIVVNSEDRGSEKIPLHRLLAIFIVGDFTITSKLIQKIYRVGASLFLLKRNLETYASFGAMAEGNYLLRQKQYSLSEKEKLAISKNIIKNKLLNQLALLRGAKIEKINKFTRKQYKQKIFKKIEKADSLATLRGIEGVMTKEYFKTYFAQIDWYRRVPRGKVDENNILLDMGYHFLFNFIDSILRLYGFDTYKGIYHQLFFQRKSLACDMMEPFRCLIDRALVKMHNLGQFKASDFGRRQDSYYLSYKHSGKYAKIFLAEILRYKEEIYNYIRDHYYLILNNEGEVKPFIIR